MYASIKIFQAFLFLVALVPLIQVRIDTERVFPLKLRGNICSTLSHEIDPRTMATQYHLKFLNLKCLSFKNDRIHFKSFTVQESSMFLPKNGKMFFRQWKSFLSFFSNEIFAYLISFSW